MGYELAPTAIGEGYRLEQFESVGSTNTVALERAAAGDPGRLWLVAERQESGRGRRGRAWATTRGNLAATLLLTDIADLGASATLGFVAGLALGDALDAVAPQADIAIGIDGAGNAGGPRYELKWPNDVLARGGKLAGILLESVQLPQGRYGLAIGIGVNVATYPQDVPYPATSLAALGAQCGAAELFLALSDAWVDNLRGWSGPNGLSRIRERWLGRAAGLGSDIVVRLPGEILRGRFETIDEECRLVLKDGDGNRRTVAAGDVHFGAIAQAG